jgi:hypothetical protein
MFRFLLTLLLVWPLAALAETPVWWQPGLSYTGEGVQSDGPRWSVELTVLSPDTARISYPSIPCAGTLQVLSADAGSILAEETITENRWLCLNGGLMLLRFDKGGVLRFDWTHGGGMAATGTLTQPGS